MVILLKNHLLLFLGIFLLSVVTVLGIQETPTSKDIPIIETDVVDIDFGEVLSGEVLSRKIRITNKGNGDLVLLKVGFTCGCTIPQIVLPSGKIVNPERQAGFKIGILKHGESAELELEFKTLGYHGKVKRQLFLYSNDPEQRTLSLPVFAEVKPGFVLEPRWMDFGKVRKNVPQSRTLMIRSTRAGEFRVLDIALPPYLTYLVDYFREGDTPCAKLTLNLNENAPVGSHSLKLKIDLDSHRIKELSLHVSLKILPPVVFNTGCPGREDVLDFGILEKNKGSTKVIEIINDNPKIPYRIDTLSIDSKHSAFIEAKWVTLEAGMRYQILVTVQPELKARFFRGTLTLLSEHPDLERKEIAFKGWIAKD